MKRVPPRRYVADLVAAAAQMSRLEVDDVMSRSSSHAPSCARFAVWRVLEERGYSPSVIARVFDYDHSTVYHGIKRSKTLELTDVDHRMLVSAVLQVAEAVSPDRTPADMAMAAIVSLERAIAAAEDVKEQLVRQVAMQRNGR